MGLEAQVLGLENYCFTISMSAASKRNQDPSKIKWALHRTMGVNFDEFDLRVARHLETQHFQISNPLSLLTSLRDKVAQIQTLHQWGVPIIPSLILRGDIDGNNHTAIQRFIRQSKHSRFILKTERGNQGLGVSLINGIDSLYSWLTTLRATRDQRFILQPFIEDAQEYRILMCGDQCLGIVEKQRRAQANDKFKHNAKHTHFKAMTNRLPKRTAMIACSQHLRKEWKRFWWPDFLMTKKL